ncbi:MAG: phosphatidylglycerophosphatase A [Bacilli bacterium]
MDLKKIALNRLKDRGVSINDMAKIVYDIQKDFIDDIDIKKCEETILLILNKREVINAVLTGIAIDEGVEKGIFDEHIYKIIMEDQGLYGVDEILALSIVNIYGSIALTNFGYVDKCKPGIIGIIDKEGKESNKCHTFLDDIVGAIVAAAASRLAHHNEDK